MGRGSSGAKTSGGGKYKLINNFEKENYSSKTEKGLLITKDGQTISFSGEEHNVIGKKEDIAKMDGAIFTHNHPTPNTFSDTDIANGLVKGNLAEMRAVTSQADVYILKNDGATLQQRRQFLAGYNQARMKATNVAHEKQRRGENINTSDYVKQRLEVYMQNNAGNYNLQYLKKKLKE